MSDDAEAHDNRLLREAMQESVPVLYFLVLRHSDFDSLDGSLG